MRRSCRLLVGVNCRDLVTLQVVPGRLEALAPQLPRGVPRVAESGVESAADAARLARAGYDVGAGGQRADAGRAIRSALAACAAGGRARWRRGSDVDEDLRHDQRRGGRRRRCRRGADAIGFVFAPSVRRLEPAQAAQLAAPARGRVALVAVTLHPTQAADR